MTPLRRVGAIGDVHAESDTLEVALTTLRRRGVDAILQVGDIVDGEGDIERTLELLQAPDVLGVRGNHERWLLQDTVRSLPFAHARSELSERALFHVESLPTTRMLATMTGRAMLCHGVGEDDMAKLLPEHDISALADIPALRALVDAGEYEWMVAGHTHKRMARVFGGVRVVNAGTLCRADGAGFCEIDFESERVTWFDVDERGRVREMGGGKIEPEPAWWAF